MAPLKKSDELDFTLFVQSKISNDRGLTPGKRIKFRSENGKFWYVTRSLFSILVKYKKKMMVKSDCVTWPFGVIEKFYLMKSEKLSWHNGILSGG